MAEYEELVKRLRNGAELLSHDGWAAGLFTQAADAIEKLIEVIQNHDFLKSLIKPGWIPVTERLPEIHKEVLVCNEDYGEAELGFSEVAVWDGNDWICTWDMESRLHFITHWMPLPEPPKEEET